VICECTPTRYDRKKQEVCNVAEELFGINMFSKDESAPEGFIGDFIFTPNPESVVRVQIAELANINVKDVERYIYLSEFNGKTIIKK